MKPITLTIDLEDPLQEYATTGRYVDITKHILDLCLALNCKATFFVVGKLARSNPSLIQTIVQHGHEIAYHSHNHVPLTKDTPLNFKAQTAEDKIFIEQISGQPLLGYRAPCFSLTPQTQWATNILTELGFSYSSSIMPTFISRFGFKNAPRAPFRWPCGLLEFPLPVTNFGPLHLPFLGGIYLYALPSWLTQFALKRAQQSEVLWTYLHPYDLDKTEKFKPFPNTPYFISLILWLARKKAEKKLLRIFGTPSYRTKISHYFSHAQNMEATQATVQHKRPAPTFGPPLMNCANNLTPFHITIPCFPVVQD